MGLTFLFLLSFCMSLSYGANILAVVPSPSYSHQVAYTHIWKQLSLRGHKVTVITTDPLKDPNLTNLTEIDMSWIYQGKAVNKVIEEMTMWRIHSITHDHLLKLVVAQLSRSEVQDLIHKKHHFDVVLVEFLYPELLAFAEIYNCPKIIFCSLDATSIFHNSMGNSINPIVYQEMGSSFYGSLNFKERLISTVYTLYTFYFYYYKAFNEKTQIVKKYFNISRTVHELVSDIDLMFINVNPILQPVRVLGPSTIEIGGSREIVDSTVLPKDISDFLDSAVEGFIYFSLGSNVQSKDLSEETLQAITEALRELPYKVLWKFEADNLLNKPENIKLIKWAPQQTVLSHPNIKLFVTQGGLQSMEEAIYGEVPFVVIPFFGDQEYNAKMMKSKGIGVIVNRIPSINKLELKNAILEVVNNPKYRDAVKRVKQLSLDFPMSGLEKAIWWIEYVIRNKGAKHLRNPAADIPFYQYYLLDVIGFFVLLLVFFYVIISTVFKWCVKLFIFRYTKRPNFVGKKDD